jgi:hypothetical protein
MYASGGEDGGLSLPYAIARTAVQHLQPGGLLILYTGVPISMQGRDPMFDQLELDLPKWNGMLMEYRVIDPDVFGDDLEDHQGSYGGSDVGRISVVGLVVRKN